jgi:hypothetical protein
VKNETLTVVDGVDGFFLDRPPSGVTCQNCCQLPAEAWWTGEGGVLAWTHGCAAAWCMHCIVKAQLAYAREHAADIPALEAKLAELERKGP